MVSQLFGRWVLLLWVSTTFITAEEDLKDVYTASSLLYHLATQQEEVLSDQEKITYSEAEVLNLWQELQENYPSESVEIAYQAYYNNNSGKAYQELKSIWEKTKKAHLESEDDLVAQATQIPYNDVNNNPDIPQKTLAKISPYLLPFEHPIRPIMDAIFKASRVTYDSESVKAAGFSILYSQPRSFIKVVRHPFLTNYLIKLYLDTDLRKKHGKEGWTWFVKRCQGVEKIHNVIKKYNIVHFGAPNKWIYPLPMQPAPLTTIPIQKQIIVLLVDDMHLVSHEKNREAWKTLITEKHLQELYTIISLSNGSSYRADNIPFSNSGKFVFIDTEYPNVQPNYGGIRPYLSRKMRNYWDNLVKTGGRKR